MFFWSRRLPVTCLRPRGGRRTRSRRIRTQPARGMTSYATSRAQTSGDSMEVCRRRRGDVVGSRGGMAAKRMLVPTRRRPPRAIDGTSLTRTPRECWAMIVRRFGATRCGVMALDVRERSNAAYSSERIDPLRGPSVNARRGSEGDLHRNNRSICGWLVVSTAVAKLSLYAEAAMARHVRCAAPCPDTALPPY